MAEIVLRIRLEAPPPGVLFAIQKGRGSSYETILAQRSTGGDLVFEFTVELRGSPPALAGPLVQGPTGGRFVYVDIGTYAGDPESPWGRRLKVPLTGITPAMLKAELLEARVPGTGRDGGPNCATPRGFAGWKVGSR